MPDSEQQRLCFRAREFKGSRFRCLLATHKSQSEVVDFLNSLVRPFAAVTTADKFMPEGFWKPDEARLGKSPGFLNDMQRRTVTEWWLAAPERANTPNWDLVSTCTIGGRAGLLLVEAKAHVGELKPDDSCGARDEHNRKRIKDDIEEVTRTLGEGWRLSADSHYQLSNRFAWAWKVANLKIPVVLVYLGFLNAAEMLHPFGDHEAWERCLLAYAEGVVPRAIWNSTGILVNNIPVIPLIRSAEVNVSTVIGGHSV